MSPPRSRTMGGFTCTSLPLVRASLRPLLPQPSDAEFERDPLLSRRRHPELLSLDDRPEEDEFPAPASTERSPPLPAPREPGSPNRRHPPPSLEAPRAVPSPLPDERAPVSTASPPDEERRPESPNVRQPPPSALREDSPPPPRTEPPLLPAPSAPRPASPTRRQPPFESADRAPSPPLTAPLPPRLPAPLSPNVRRVTCSIPRRWSSKLARSTCAGCRRLKKRVLSLFPPPRAVTSRSAIRRLCRSGTIGTRPSIEEAPRRSVSPSERIRLLRPPTKSLPSAPDTPLRTRALR